MFFDVVLDLDATRSFFNESVADDFGRGFDADVFEPYLEALRGLCRCEEEAELIVAKINQLLQESHSPGF